MNVSKGIKVGAVKIHMITKILQNSDISMTLNVDWWLSGEQIVDYYPRESAPSYHVKTTYEHQCHLSNEAYFRVDNVLT